MNSRETYDRQTDTRGGHTNLLYCLFGELFIEILITVDIFTPQKCMKRVSFSFSLWKNTNMYIMILPKSVYISSRSKKNTMLASLQNFNHQFSKIFVDFPVSACFTQLDTMRCLELDRKIKLKYEVDGLTQYKCTTLKSYRETEQIHFCFNIGLYHFSIWLFALALSLSHSIARSFFHFFFGRN